MNMDKVANITAIEALESLRKCAAIRLRSYKNAPKAKYKKEERQHCIDAETINIIALNMAIVALGGTLPQDKSQEVADQLDNILKKYVV